MRGTLKVKKEHMEFEGFDANMSEGAFVFLNTKAFIYPFIKPVDYNKRNFVLIDNVCYDKILTFEIKELFGHTYEEEFEIEFIHIGESYISDIDLVKNLLA